MLNAPPQPNLSRAAQLFGVSTQVDDTLFQRVIAARAAGVAPDPLAEVDRRRAAERATFDRLRAEETARRFRRLMTRAAGITLFVAVGVALWTS